jgi:hypothetical protein
LNIPYIETSAKNPTNVEQSFKTMVTEEMPNKSSVEPENANIKITSQAKPPKTSSGFC